MATEDGSSGIGQPEELLGSIGGGQDHPEVVVAREGRVRYGGPRNRRGHVGRAVETIAQSPTRPGEDQLPVARSEADREQWGRVQINVLDFEGLNGVSSEG